MVMQPQNKSWFSKTFPMKFLFWDAKGLANAPTRLALKSMILVHKLDLCYIVGPWVHFDKLLYIFFDILGLKLLTFNIRTNTTPNLWCFSAKNLDSTLISITNQFVSFRLQHNSNTFHIAANYASTCLFIRRILWHDLSFIHSHHPSP